MGPRGFGRIDEAHADPMSVASTNFLASATLVGRQVPDALLIDMGSTTTDIIAIAGGKPAPRGLTDGERLATGELVYTGLTRTDVSVVAQRATFRGRAATARRRRLRQHGRRSPHPRHASDRRRPACHSSTAAASRCRRASRASPAASVAMPLMRRPTTGAPARARGCRSTDRRGARRHTRSVVGIGAAGERADHRRRDRRSGDRVPGASCSGARRQASARWPQPRPTAAIGRRAAHPPSPSPCSPTTSSCDPRGRRQSFPSASPRLLPRARRRSWRWRSPDTSAPRRSSPAAAS